MILWVLWKQDPLRYIGFFLYIVSVVNFTSMFLKPVQLFSEILRKHKKVYVFQLIPVICILARFASLNQGMSQSRFFPCKCYLTCSKWHTLTCTGHAVRTLFAGGIRSFLMIINKGGLIVTGFYVSSPTH